MAFNLINFKKGTLAGLNTLKTQQKIEEGTFYLTIDDQKNTSRLYIGTDTETVLPVNSNITVVNSTNDLTNVHAGNFNDGDFAYVTTGNILAVRYNGSWTQVNAPDLNHIQDFTPHVETSNGTATISWEIRDKNNNTINTKDDPAVTPAITMSGANGVTVSNSGRDLTVTGTSYNLTSAAVVNESNTAIVKLQSKANASANAVDVNSITFRTGSNVQITGETANDIVISATDSVITSASVNNNVSTDPHTTGFDITFTDSTNNSATATVDPKITLGAHTASGEEFSFVNGEVNLPVYTKTEIDNMKEALDALQYRGTVGTGGSKAVSISGIAAGEGAEGIKIGFTYKLVGDSTVSYPVPIAGGTSVTAHGGDLIIANGTEGSDGKITSATLYYDVVPSGDEKIEYKGSGATNNGNGIQIEDGANTVLASIEIAQGNQIGVTSAHTGTNGEKAVVTVAHGAISNSTTGDANTPGAVTAANTQNTHSEKTFNVVTGLTTDNGHVTGTTITPIKVVDTVSQLDIANTAIAVSTANNVSTVAETIVLKDEDNTEVNRTSVSFSIGSQNLNITSSENAITANLVWGNF